MTYLWSVPADLVCNRTGVSCSLLDIRSAHAVICGRNAKKLKVAEDKAGEAKKDKAAESSGGPCVTKAMSNKRSLLTFARCKASFV